MFFKIPYKDKLSWLASRKIAAHRKSVFVDGIFRTAQRIGKNALPAPVNVDLFSFSGKSAFADQVLSVLSFLYYVGIPTKWTIYSDKTYDQQDTDAFLALFPFCEIKEWDAIGPIDRLVRECNDHYFLAKKINVVLNHPKKATSIYADSDIVFYAKFRKYLASGLLDGHNWFMADTLSDDDANWFTPNAIVRLNSGFLVFNADFNGRPVLDYLEKLNGRYLGYFLEQNAIEQALQAQDAKVLDPRTFILETDDQFLIKEKYSTDKMALRHYTSPVRHKLWQFGWEWHFGK